jgi:hypothetical protein
MSKNEEFSMEQSEELIANMNSAKPSEFQQLRSALNLLGHVPELPVTAMPPVLPSGIAQPVALLPVRSTKPHRTIITSVIVTGMLASASLAAAAVTGIGPAPIVNIGHETAKFVKGVASAVTHVVTGGSAVTTEVISPHPQIPRLTSAPTGGEEGSSNTSDGELSKSSDELIPGLLSPLSPQTKKPEDGKSSGSEKSKTSHESQSPQSEDSPTQFVSAIPIPSSITIGTKEHTEIEAHKTPEPSASSEPSNPTGLPTALPSLNSNDDSSDGD